MKGMRVRFLSSGFLEREVRKDNLPMMSFGDNPEAPQPREMIDLEATFEKLENELNEVRSLFIEWISLFQQNIVNNVE